MFAQIASEEKNLFLQSIKEEQRNNQRFMLVMSVRKERVLSVWNSSQNCDYMLFDMAKTNDDTFVCLYDSQIEGKNNLKEALEFISNQEIRIVGNTKWIPTFA